MQGSPRMPPPVADIREDKPYEPYQIFLAVSSLAMVMVVMSPESMMVPMVSPAAGCENYHGRWPHDHGWRDDHDRRGWQDREEDPDAHGHMDSRMYGEWHSKTCDTQVRSPSQTSVGAHVPVAWFCPPGQDP